jgi:hypothetical protein
MSLSPGSPPQPGHLFSELTNAAAALEGDGSTVFAHACKLGLEGDDGGWQK